MSYLTQFGKLIRDERQMKAMTGVSSKELEHLVTHFAKASEQIKTEEYEKGIKKRGRKKRKRRSGAGPKGRLDSHEKQLFYILNYGKVYPTFDVHGANFGYNRGTACDKVHQLLPVLLRTLRDIGCAPKRKIKNTEDFKEVFGEVESLLLDATERRHFRHKEYERQKENYSGKKNVIRRRI